MALVGKWIQEIDVPSETETHKVKVEYPAGLPESSPDFDKSGMTIEEDQPVINKEFVEYENVYITVHSVNTFKLSGTPVRNYMNINYRVYNNKSESLNDVFSSFFDDHITLLSVDYNSGLTPTEQAYNYLKSMKGFEVLKND